MLARWSGGSPDPISGSGRAPRRAGWADQHDGTSTLFWPRNRPMRFPTPAAAQINVPVLGVVAPIGILLQTAFDRAHIALSRFNIVFFVLLSALDLIALVMMFLGRYLMRDERGDLDFAGNSFDLLFMMYGLFLCLTSLLIWIAYRWQPAIFAESDVRLWRIFLYTADAGLRGFLRDLSDWMDYRILTPLGFTHYVDLALKTLMGITVVAGAAKYYDITKGKQPVLPP